MKKFVASIMLIAMLAVSCLSGFGFAEDAEYSVFRTLYSGEITTLNYLYTATTNEFAVAANVIDTLVELSLIHI